MRYLEIEPMCRPLGVGVRGCPYDGLGCTGGDRCSINSTDTRTAAHAFNASKYGHEAWTAIADTLEMARRFAKECKR